MPRYPAHSSGRSCRSGKVLILFIILLPVLLGLLALVTDLGLLLSYHCEVQNAADGAALAAATQLFQDWALPYDEAKAWADAQNTANTFVHHNNGLPRATVEVKFYDSIDVDPYRTLYQSPDRRGTFVEAVVT